MKNRFLGLAALLCAAALGAEAQEEIGRNEYMVACAGCHGESGKGNGPLAGLLNIETPDLTTLASAKGGGEFPFQYTVWMVDGRNIIRAHGSEMPIWGDRFQSSADQPARRNSRNGGKGRILSLVYYIESIQQ